VKLTNRDKVLVLIVPAIFIVGGYAWWINSAGGKQKEVSRLRDEIDKAIKAAPPAGAIEKEQARVMELRAGVRQLETALALDKSGWDSFVGQVFNPATRQERVGKLNALLHSFGLTLLGDEPADVAAAAGSASRPSAALEAFGKAIGERSPQFKPTMWRIRLYGRYPNLVRALNRLADGETLCVLIGLTMAEWDINAPAQEWTLLVWI
jgi:hypothetical protein